MPAAEPRSTLRHSEDGAAVSFETADTFTSTHPNVSLSTPSSFSAYRPLVLCDLSPPSRSLTHGHRQGAHMASDGIVTAPPKKLKIAHGSSLPGSAPQLPPPTFDLDTWAGNYDGVPSVSFAVADAAADPNRAGALLPLRLSHIAVHCPPLRRQALVLALAATKKGKDLQLYGRIVGLAGMLGEPQLAAVDQEWVGKTEQANKAEIGRKEGELRGYKNNLIRESIRMGQEDLAKSLLATGGPPPDPHNPAAITGYNAAYQAFAKMRDFCTTPTHVAAMTLRLIDTSVLQAVAAQEGGAPANTFWQAVLISSSRLRSVGVKEEEQKKLDAIAHAVTGLAHLSLTNYREAARALLATPFTYNGLGPIHGVDFGRRVASANDIAIYCGLCALATFSRQDLIDRVLGGPFRQFLELEPHIRKAISLHTTAKYAACLSMLRHYYSDWTLDVFLGAPAARGGSHVDALIALIRKKSIVAYFSSFSEVSLTALADNFPSMDPSPTAMEDEVTALIQSGDLDARLDAVNGVLIAPQTDLRQSTQADAQRAADEVERTLLLRLHKVNVTLAGLEIPRPQHDAYAVGGGWNGSMQAGNGYMG